MSQSPSSLVRGTKSSTTQVVRVQGIPEWEIDAVNRELAQHARDSRLEVPKSAYLADAGEWIDPHAGVELDERKAGQYLRLTAEDWRAIERTPEGAPYTPLDADHCVRKATIIVDTSGKNTPPPQGGDRWTKRLSDRGARAIEDSAKYQHRLGRGYRTFLTLTFTREWRAQMEKWDLMSRNETERGSMGGLVTTFINVLQQRHRNGMTFAGHYRRAGKQQRGGGYEARGPHYRGRIRAANKSTRWTPIKWQEGFKIPAASRPFQFAWVAENPLNSEGERNPHIHVLMNWHVKLAQFHAWSRWIERTWGKGFAKLERIRKPAAAASYMAKAAQYIAKGKHTEQGPVRGNRYGIARDGRAPPPRLIGVFVVGNIRNVIDKRLEAGRERWPERLWFHNHGFGAGTRTAWQEFWAGLLASGFHFEPPPKSLPATRYHNARARSRRSVRDMLNECQDWFLEQCSRGAEAIEGQ